MSQPGTSHAGGGTGSHAGLQETRLKEQGRTSLSTRDVRAQGSSSCPNNPRSSSPWPLPVQPLAAEQHREWCPESPSCPVCPTATTTPVTPGVRRIGLQPGCPGKTRRNRSHRHHGALERADACVGCSGVYSWQDSGDGIAPPQCFYWTWALPK